MAKIKQGSLVLDDGDKIIFTDSSDIEHEIYFDDILQRFIVLGDLQVDNFIDVTDSVVNIIPPTVNDSGYRIPTMWIDTATDSVYVCTDNTTGAAVWIPLSGSGSGGSLVIQDEGNVVDANTTTLNFVGDTVQVIPDSPGVVKIYIPSLSFVSHWNTDDGSNNNLIGDVSTTQRLLSDPVGTFYIPVAWSPETNQETINSTSISYTSPFKCSFDTAITNFVVNVSQNGIVIRSHQLNNINGNYDATVGDIRIQISGWEVEYFKFKANIDITINIGSILPTSGAFTVEMAHDNGGGSVFTKNQDYVMYDGNTNQPVINSLSISENTISSSKYLSGVRYYSTGDTFNIGIADIDYINDSTYINNFIFINTNNEYGISDYYIDSSDLTGWTSAYNNTNASYNTSSAAIDEVNFRYIGSSANISARYIDWANGSYITTTNESILVDTYNTTSTDNEEHFNDEDRRITPSLTAWDSTSLLNSNDMMVVSGRLIRQYGNWTSYSPTNTASYGSSLDQFYYRGYRHNNISHTNGKIYIPGITESNIIDDNIIIEISLNGVDWFNVNEPYTSGALSDGDGCRTNIGVTVLPYIDFTLGSGGFTDASTGSIGGWGIYMKINVPNGSSVELSELNIIDWT